VKRISSLIGEVPNSIQLAESSRLIDAYDCTKSKTGFIDKTGKFVIEPKFDNAGPFSEGLARATITEGGEEKLGFIDHSGIVEGFIMTQLLFLALFFFLTFPVSAEKETPKIDLRVNGVGAWTPYSTVINKLGKPLRSKKVRTPANLSCSGEDETTLTLFYSGLEVNLLGSGKGRSLEVYSFIVTSPKWSASGVNIGADIKQVLVKFGEPDFKEESSKETAFVYSMKDGIGAVTFSFRHGKLIEISMEGTLC